MTCKKCGNENVEHARFCILCGTELMAKPQTKAQAEKKPRPGTRIRPGNTVRPIADNPAQPSRGAKPLISPKQAEPHRKAATLSPEPERKKEVPRRPEATVDREEKRRSTILPERKPPAPEAFDEVEAEDEDEGEYEDTIRHRIISAIAGLFLLVALSVAFWLIVTPGGQVFRAGLSLSAPADAYKRLGDQYRQNAQYTKAAEAYENARKLDPQSFEYTLVFAKTQELVGNLEKAEKGYGMSIQLSPDEAEPYQLLCELYTRLGKPESAEAVRALWQHNNPDQPMFDETPATENSVPVGEEPQ